MNFLCAKFPSQNMSTHQEWLITQIVIRRVNSQKKNSYVCARDIPRISGSPKTPNFNKMINLDTVRNTVTGLHPHSLSGPLYWKPWCCFKFMICTFTMLLDVYFQIMDCASFVWFCAHETSMQQLKTFETKNLLHDWWFMQMLWFHKTITYTS